ncbi:MAG: sensor histidine kinase [Jatrophihabitans sp.]|uniref:sensor histidine kinase n=1 Tax=Jatrophihabitans sp. TaxID=1932789 RepID=UPI003F80AEDD
MPARSNVRDAETRLAELVSALDHLPAMVAYWDRDLHNRLANAAYLEWFGIGPDRMVGMHIRDLLGPELYARNLPYITAALAGEQQLFERVLVDTAGRTRYTQASYVPHLVDGEVLGFFVLVSDITARVQAEQALHESVAQVALLQERQRIAADMHDLVIQNLFAAGLLLQTAELACTGEALDAVRAATTRVEDAIAALRLTIAGLTRDVAPERLAADIEQVVAACRPALGLDPTVTVSGPPGLVPSDARPEVLAVLQEALTNVAKHAAATSVDVTLTATAQETRLVVRDGGRGMGGTSRSSGLGNMRLRAERLGGRLTVSANDPHGTIVDWRVPASPPPSPPHHVAPRS